MIRKLNKDKLLGSHNTALGPRAGRDLLTTNKCILIGNNAQSGNYSYCIILGADITAKHDYHLLIPDLDIDKKMTEEEFNVIFPVLNIALRMAIPLIKDNCITEMRAT